jgi:crossover junction endodeoxyribonuclease RuvC
MVSLGLDLSLSKTGYVTVSGGKILKEELITSKPSGESSLAELKRLIGIRDKIKLTGIDIVVIEGPAMMIRQTTAFVQLCALNYMVREHVMLADIPFVIVAPTTLKKFVTGKGNCQKDLMLLEVYKRYGVYLTDNNISDAFGLAIIGEKLIAGGESNLKEKEVTDLLKKQLYGKFKVHESDSAVDVPALPEGDNCVSADADPVC